MYRRLFVRNYHHSSPSSTLLINALRSQVRCLVGQRQRHDIAARERRARDEHKRREDEAMADDDDNATKVTL
ncbi:hypothetical protein ACN47E_004191 [Coniothyrium glycines]